jgi:hypothetical protein
MVNGEASGRSIAHTTGSLNIATGSNAAVTTATRFLRIAIVVTLVLIMHSA